MKTRFVGIMTNYTQKNRGVWAFSGKDIFASVSGKLPFEIKDELICLYDFEDNYYEIDFEGNHIK